MKDINNTELLRLLSEQIHESNVDMQQGVVMILLVMFIHWALS